MTQQTFPAGAVQRIMISDIESDLSIHGWEQQTISIDSDGEISSFLQEGDALMLGNIDGSLELWVPFETSINARNVGENVTIEHVRQINVQDIGGDASCNNVAGAVIVKSVGNSAELKNIGGELRIDNVGDDLTVLSIAGAVTIGDIGNDVET